MKRVAPRRGVESVVMALVCLFISACSSDSDSDNGNAGPVPDETENCPPLERSKLFPIIGAFSGPDPGPCTLLSSGGSYSFRYGTDSVLQSQVAASGEDSIEFHYAESRLVSETRTQPGGTTTTTYAYASDAIEMVTIQQDVATTGYVYELDKRGYIRSARLLNTVTSPSIPTHYTYEYQDCMIQWRVAYDPNDSVNLDLTLQYSHDEQGRLIKRTSSSSEELFDYSCW